MRGDAIRRRAVAIAAVLNESAVRLRAQHDEGSGISGQDHARSSQSLQAPSPGLDVPRRFADHAAAEGIPAFSRTCSQSKRFSDARDPGLIVELWGFDGLFINRLLTLLCRLSAWGHSSAAFGWFKTG